jgi:DNA-binding transcriptional LysR family regulator
VATPVDVDPPLPGVTIPQLTYLVAVADATTFAAAASSVGVTTSALSQGLAELERRLGIDLFERVGRRQVLRDEAREVVAYARRVVADTGDLARWVVATRDGRSGRLRVGMIDAAAVNHYPGVLRSFRRANPDVDLRLTVAPSGELLDQLRGGALDLAVVVDGPNADLDVEPLLDEPLVLVPAEGAPADAVKDPRRWGPWLSFPHGSRTRAVVETALGARGAPLEVVGESNQPEVLREMARLGLGWTVLPVVQAGRSPRRELEVLANRTLVLARRRNRIDHPAADSLAAALSAPSGVRGSARRRALN